MVLSVSPEWWATVGGSHTASCRVDVLFAGEVVAQGLPVTAGQVTMDRTALVRGRVELTFADPEGFPLGPQDLLAPFGAELRVYRGVRHPLSGVVELVPWGVFGVQRCTVDRQGFVTQVQGLDRMQRLIDAGIDAELQIASGTNVVTALTTLAQVAWPNVPLAVTPSDFTTPEVVVSAGDDVARRCLDLAQAAGMEVFFDHDGVLVVQDEPGAADPVATIREGDGGALVGLNLTLDRAEAVNRVTAVGEHSGLSAPVTATATDLNPASPTMWDGPFGRKPIRISSPLYATTGQAQAAADAALLKRRGVPKVIEFEMVPNPAVQAGDVVTVFAERLVPSEQHVIDKVVMPVTPDGGGVRMATRAVLVG